MAVRDITTRIKVVTFACFIMI